MVGVLATVTVAQAYYGDGPTNYQDSENERSVLQGSALQGVKQYPWWFLRMNTYTRNLLFMIQHINARTMGENGLTRPH